MTGLAGGLDSGCEERGVKDDFKALAGAATLSGVGSIGGAGLEGEGWKGEQFRKVELRFNM